MGKLVDFLGRLVGHVTPHSYVLLCSLFIVLRISVPSVAWQRRPALFPEMKRRGTPFERWCILAPAPRWPTRTAEHRSDRLGSVAGCPEQGCSKWLRRRDGATLPARAGALESGMSTCGMCGAVQRLGVSVLGDGPGLAISDSERGWARCSTAPRFRRSGPLCAHLQFCMAARMRRFYASWSTAALVAPSQISALRPPCIAITQMGCAAVVNVLTRSVLRVASWRHVVVFLVLARLEVASVFLRPIMFRSASLH